MKMTVRRDAARTSFAHLVAGRHPRRHSPSEMIISVGPLTLSGWRLWAVAGGLMVVGLLFASLGVYALSSRGSAS